jgi:hypothetical protein
MAKDILEKKKGTIEDYINTDDEVDEKKVKHLQLKTINQLIYSSHFVKIDSLINFLKSIGKPVSSNKSQIIKDLFYKYKIPPVTLINSIFAKSDLRKVCKFLELPYSGVKHILIERLLERLPLDQIPLKDKKKNRDSLKDYILRKLNEIKLIASKITGKTDLVNAFKNAVINLRVRSSIKFEITEKVNKDPVIMYKENTHNVYVTVWFISNKKARDLSSLNGRLLADYKNFERNIIYYIYDSTNKCTPDELELINGYVETVIKTQRDFSFD